MIHNINAIQRDWSKLGWAVVWIGWACLTVLHGFEQRREFQRFQADAETTEGVVTDAHQGWKSRDDGEPPHIEYVFTVNGTEYSGSSEIYVPVGDPVEVRYLPTDPTTNLAAGHNNNWRTYIAMAVFMAGFGVYLEMMGYSPKSAKHVSDVTQYPLEPTPFLRFPIVILSATSAYMLFNAPDQHPYWYYQLLRWLASGTAAMLAYYAYQWHNRWAPWLFGFIALLFNPLIPFHFERQAWAIIDLAAAVVMLTSALLMKPPAKESTGDVQ